MDASYRNADESKRIKKRTAALSGSVGIFMLVSLFLSYAFSLFYRSIYADITEGKTGVLLGGVFEAFGISRTRVMVAVREFLASGALDEVFSMISMLVCIFLPAYILGKMWEISISDSFVTKGKFVKGTVFLYAFCQLVMLCMTNIANGLWSFLFPSASGVASPLDGALSENVFVLVISFLSTCVMVPVVEEYVFRGVVFRVFNKIGTSFAVVASALCFGVMHGSVLQCMYAIGFGLISAMFVVVTGNIKTSVLFHALNNTILFLSSVIAVKFGQTFGDIFDDVHILFVLSFSFYGMYLFFSHDGILASFREKTGFDSETEENAKLSALFSLPFLFYVILFAARCVLGAV